RSQPFHPRGAGAFVPLWGANAPAATRLEGELADPHLVAGREAGPLERRDYADLAQALLDVGERLGVREVVAPDQELDPPPAHAEGAVLAGDVEALLPGGRVGDVLGLERRLAGDPVRRGPRRLLRNDGEDRRAQLGEARPRGRRGREDSGHP